MRKNKKEIESGYDSLLQAISQIVDTGRSQATRDLNSILSAIYWEIGRRIVAFEQQGKHRADYGERIIESLSHDLKARFGRGFGRRTLFQIRAFYLLYEAKVQTLFAQSQKPMDKEQKVQTLFAQFPKALNSYDVQIFQILSGELDPEYFQMLRRAFPLSWSHYIRFLAIKGATPREFYEAESLRNGWSVRQLDRQIATRFYERTALSRNKTGMLQKGALPQPSDIITPEEAIKDPYILEFLHLKDEYSESDFEDQLIHRLEDFLMELGGDFAFIGRQKRLRIGDEWYRIDLLFFHRRLRCLVVIDLKVGKFSHADAGQMHLYLNYAREHWTNPDEKPPVGLILCSQKDSAIAKYSLEGLPNKVMASEYKLALPGEKLLAAEIDKARERIERRSK
jgi:predicted nuclease of restriction endonuclease-like (RecB) superfamily